MATSPRAAAPTGTSGRGWTIVRQLGSRAVATSLATGAPNEPLVVQTFRVEDGERTGDPVRDLKALSNLRHTNVARIKEVIEKDSEVTIVSPFNDGETLAALRKAGPLPLAVELRILVDVLAGLAAIHGAKDAKLKPLGIVHGEVAPANIVIGTDGVPKIIQLAGVHANPGVQGGDTLGYVAPEILLADDSFDQRVDVYSVGVMLWEALTGSTLFPETNAGAIVTRHLSGRIRKPTIPADAPWAEGLVEVAQKAIATDPGSRYASANELAAEIKRIAKTNVAPTMKVAAAVKERGGDAINARRAALGLPALTIPKATAVAIKPPVAKPEPPKAVALGPAPTPANGAPTTKPVPAEDIVANDENFRETAQKPIPAIRFAPPEPVDDPSVHDRITSPSPIPAVKDQPGQVEDQPADFSDLAFDSEPPPPPAAPPGPPPKKAPEKVEAVAAAPIAPHAELTPPPPAAFSPSPFVAPTPRPEQPSDTPSASPIASPFDEAIGVPGDDAQKKKRVVIFAAIGAVVLILIFGLRSCLSGKPEADTAAKQPAPTATATTTQAAKTAEPTATVAADPAIPATNTATTANTAAPTATTELAPTASAEPTVAAKNDPPPSNPSPPTTTTGGGGKAPPTGTTPVKTKPKSYDPLGI